MIIDATFWVTVSFFIFLGILIYFKIPQKIKEALEQNILKIVWMDLQVKSTFMNFLLQCLKMDLLGFIKYPSLKCLKLMTRFLRRSSLKK